MKERVSPSPRSATAIRYAQSGHGKADSLNTGERILTIVGILFYAGDRFSSGAEHEMTAEPQNRAGQRQSGLLDTGQRAPLVKLKGCAALEDETFWGARAPFG